MEQIFYTADDIMRILCIGKTQAYNIITELNNELKHQGYRICRGRVNRRFFEKCYCYKEENYASV